MANDDDDDDNNITFSIPRLFHTIIWRTFYNFLYSKNFSIFIFDMVISSLLAQSSAYHDCVVTEILQIIFAFMFK